MARPDPFYSPPSPGPPTGHIGPAFNTSEVSTCSPPALSHLSGQSTPAPHPSLHFLPLRPGPGPITPLKGGRPAETPADPHFRPDRPGSATAVWPAAPFSAAAQTFGQHLDLDPDREADAAFNESICLSEPLSGDGALDAHGLHRAPASPSISSVGGNNKVKTKTRPVPIGIPARHPRHSTALMQREGFSGSCPTATATATASLRTASLLGTGQSLQPLRSAVSGRSAPVPLSAALSATGTLKGVSSPRYSPYPIGGPRITMATASSVQHDKGDKVLLVVPHGPPPGPSTSVELIDVNLSVSDLRPLLRQILGLPAPVFIEERERSEQYKATGLDRLVCAAYDCGGLRVDTYLLSWSGLFAESRLLQLPYRARDRIRLVKLDGDTEDKVAVLSNVPDKDGLGQLLEYILWRDEAKLEMYLRSSKAAWKGMVRNVDYLECGAGIKRLVGSWWAKWIKTQPADRIIVDPQVLEDEDGLAPGLQGDSIATAALPGWARKVPTRRSSDTDSAMSEDTLIDADELARRGQVEEDSELEDMLSRL